MTISGRETVTKRQNETLTHQYHPSSKMDLVRTCASAKLSDGELVKMGSVVVLKPQIGEDLPRLGRIKEFRATVQDPQIIDILVQEIEVGDETLPYRLPQLNFLPYYLSVSPEASVSLLISISKATDKACQDIECVVHTFHNCHRYNCDMTKTRVMYQEHKKIQETGYEISHHGSQDDCILNLAHMRNAWLLQVWQPPHPLRNKTIEESATEGVQLQYDRSAQAELDKAQRKSRQTAAQEKKEARWKLWPSKIAKFVNDKNGVEVTLEEKL